MAEFLMLTVIFIIAAVVITAQRITSKKLSEEEKELVKENIEIAKQSSNKSPISGQLNLNLQSQSINKRHRSVEALSSAANFFGWILIITIIGIPIGISLLLFGHMTQAAIETEYNSRSTDEKITQTNLLLKELLSEMKSSHSTKNIDA